MNKETRSKIKDIIDKLMAIEASLSDIMYDEETKMSSLPEGLQCSDMYCKMENAVDSIDTAITNIQEAEEALEEIT